MGEDATDSTRFIRFSLRLTRFVTTRLQGMEMRKNYADSPPPQDAATFPSISTAKALGKLNAEAREGAPRRSPP
jgi:hypothetical protein